MQISQPAAVQQTSPATKTYKIGDTGPGGGIVFWVSGNSGKEVSRHLGELNWYDAIRTAKNYTGGGFSDWHLPSKDELNLIYENLHKYENMHKSGVVDLIGENSPWFWSSNPDEFIDYAVLQYFKTGFQFPDLKDRPVAVRAVRAF